MSAFNLPDMKIRIGGVGDCHIHFGSNPNYAYLGPHIDMFVDRDPNYKGDGTQYGFYMTIEQAKQVRTMLGAYIEMAEQWKDPDAGRGEGA